MDGYENFDLVVNFLFLHWMGRGEERGCVTLRGISFSQSRTKSPFMKHEMRYLGDVFLFSKHDVYYFQN